MNVCRLHNWIYKWQDAERRRIISEQRPHQLLILLDYANRYTHWQQDGECCKHDRQSSHLVVYVLSNPTYGTSAKITKTGHRCEVWTFWNEDPKQTPECIHAALRTIIVYEMKRYAGRGVKLTEVVIFSDRCGEQFSGRKNFRMSSESAALLKLLILWIFACPHHFAGVWDAWGGSEAKLLKNIEILGHDTIRCVIDAVLKLREVRKELIDNANANTVADLATAADTTDNSGVQDDASDSEDSCTEREDVRVEQINSKSVFKVHAAHIKLLQLCKCRSAAGCTCEPDERVPDTIFYRRDPKYEAEPIKGCASMFAYLFHPRRKYIVHVREFACETCPGCKATRPDDVRYTQCLDLNTVRAQSYKGRGYKTALRTDRCRTTGWVEHKIVPLKTTALAGTRATDGLTHVDHRARLEYVGRLKPGENVFMANIGEEVHGNFTARHFWVAQLLPPPNSNSSVVWKTRHALPPDVTAGSYCCKIQWFKRKSKEGRVFKLASAQYISLSCIVPVDYKIVLRQGSSSTTILYELDQEVEKKILTTLNGLVVDD